MLLLLLWLLPVHSTESPRTFHKSIQACPSVGYFFERQGADYACYLCYCKSDIDAVCMLRDSERCNEENYSHQTDGETKVRKHRRRKHRRRPRRSAGLMDLFFKETKKEQFMKSMVLNSGEGCKPKDSKSIGCPPKDWCEGCLVCDCDDESQWQCHVMSFCDDKPLKPPKVRKLKKAVTSISPGLENDENEETTTTATNKKTVNKNSKRSTKLKKRFKKKNNTTTTRKPQPKPTAKPLISVQTKKALKRKNDKNMDVLVIKKYISTLAPITEPELLKYKNDPKKLAQILYQQYENSTEANPVKREIRSEPKVGSKMLLTHGFTKENKVNSDTAISKNMGDKIISKKQKSKLRLNNNPRGRKPMNVKEHNDRNTKMKAKQEKREKKRSTNFYSIQKELLELENSMPKKKVNKFKSKKAKGNHERKGKIKLSSRIRRDKRDVQLILEDTRNSTNMENEIVNTSSVLSELVSETPATLFTNNDETTSNLNSYVYTVDNTNTPYENSNGISNIDIGYEITATNVNIIPIGGFETENSRFTDPVTYTTLTDSATYTTIQDVSTTENLNEIDYSLQTHNLTDYNVSEAFIQEHRPSQSNYSLNTTAIVDLLHYKQIESTESFTTETTTVLETLGTELIENEKQYTHKTKICNNNNTTSNIINEVCIQDVDKLNTDLDIYKLKNQFENKKSNANTINNITAGLSNSSGSKIDNKHTRIDFYTMLQDFTNNTNYKSKHNRMMAIQYLKKLYSKLLSNNKNQTLTNVVVMQSICDTFGPCKISSSSVEVINSKIVELITETKRVLNAISRIKFLLESIENSNNITGNTNEEVEFRSSVKKLNTILTDSWATPLNETQMSKMKIIKTNIKVFVSSISKFAIILNDILRIIRSDTSKFNSMRRGKILLNKVTRQKSSGEPLHKIKRLLIKYNILQNSFMRNVYQAISDLELQNDLSTMAVQQIKPVPKNRRYKMSVNKYMNRIIYNLKKLKEFALKMGDKERVKRDTMRDDDAVEYLLTLMEYLLKKNNPLDSPPVADGIDLLIDAIRRAPDIKQIKKKILNPSITSPTNLVNELSKSSSESEDLSLFKNNTENFKDITDMSFEKQFYNETQILHTNTDHEIEEHKTTTEESTNILDAAARTKYIDVEDMVFNNDGIQKVYMATFPPDDNTEDPYFVNEIPELRKRKELNSSRKYPVLRHKLNEERTFILTNKTEAETQATIDMNSSTVKSKTQFDLLNEEYERRLKVKNLEKTVKIKNKKQKRPKKKQKVADKTDVSSITKEVDDEKIRSNVIAEETMLRKHMLSSVDYGPFKSDGEDSVSGDTSPLDGAASFAFPSFFT